MEFQMPWNMFPNTTWRWARVAPQRSCWLHIRMRRTPTRLRPQPTFYDAVADSANIKEDVFVNVKATKNALSVRNVQAEYLNASANNAADSATATNELNAFRATLQRMQQALAKAEHEDELKI